MTNFKFTEEITVTEKRTVEITPGFYQIGDYTKVYLTETCILSVYDLKALGVLEIRTEPTSRVGVKFSGEKYHAITGADFWPDYNRAMQQIKDAANTLIEEDYNQFIKPDGSMQIS